MAAAVAAAYDPHLERGRRYNGRADLWGEASILQYRICFEGESKCIR
jgi:hypothetical protein